MLVRPPGWLDTTRFDPDAIAIAESPPPAAALPRVASDFGVPLIGPDLPSSKRLTLVFVLGLIATVLVGGSVAWVVFRR
jgi:hypothetical protein